MANYCLLFGRSLSSNKSKLNLKSVGCQTKGKRGRGYFATILAGSWDQADPF